ncbi:ABC transporter ATP-binding protein/permease [Endozoicomonadaceae bacterium StTr2]
MKTNTSPRQPWPEFLRQVWRLSAPYWKSEDKWRAWLLLGAVIALNYLIVELAVLYSNWNRDFFNLMQNEEWANFWNMLAQFAGIMVLYTCVDLTEDVLRRTLHIRWRRWMTFSYLERWLTGSKLYRQQLHPEASDNPDQRVSRDIHEFCHRTMSMGLDLLRTVTSLFSFTLILWNLSGSLEFELGGSQWVIPGYMVWVAILYSIVGTWLTHKVARQLTGLNFQQERREADFRFHLMRIREHAESVTMQQGESAEKQRAIGFFGHIWNNWNRLTWVKLRFNGFTSGYNEVARIFPYLVAAPRMMSGALQLGDMMQTATGFYRVQEAFSWFVDSYEQVAEWRAVTDRLLSFSGQIDELSENVSPTSTGQPGWETLEVHDPERNMLFAAGAVNLDGHTLIRGPSGSGKSTLFRSLAGIWPFHQGEITMPSGDSQMFIPQKPYLPAVPLHEILCYPHQPGRWSLEACGQALAMVGLKHLKSELEQEENWQQRLSGGESQRLMIARAIIQQPRWLFLDESLSALDTPAAQRMQQLLQTELPDSRIIVISHQQHDNLPFDQVLDVCPETRQLKEVTA